MESKLEGIKRILNTYGMTKNDLSEIVLKGSNFNDVAHEIVKLFAIPDVSGSATDFYTDLMKLINAYCKQGLKMPDLVHKMEYATDSCKLS